MSKKNKPRRPYMSEWADGELVHYTYLIEPMYKILFEGYTVQRKAFNSFDYAGYNIGENERVYNPTPAERFAPRWLANEAKHKRSLIDNILLNTFQLGMEYSRRLDARKGLPYKVLQDVLHRKVHELNLLKKQLSEYDENFKEQAIPDESEIEDLLIDEVDLDGDSDVENVDTKEED